jgi:hypothetical protein
MTLLHYMCGHCMSIEEKKGKACGAAHMGGGPHGVGSSALGARSLNQFCADDSGHASETRGEKALWLIASLLCSVSSFARQCDGCSRLILTRSAPHTRRMLDSADHLGVDQLGFAFLSNTYLDLPRSAAITGSLVKSAHGQRRPE